jgi:heme-degrading monooxygenase HmoA
MFIAMNRFRVKSGAEGAFEKVWPSRDSYLDRVPGFVEFHLLKGPGAEDHTLYASHTVWQSKAAFEAWTKSEEFRAAHARAGNEVTGIPNSRASRYDRRLLPRRRSHNEVASASACPVALTAATLNRAKRCGCAYPWNGRPMSP